ncbi:MAG: hypothetical protein E7284_05060 [Lachnospiraceae bacterium]|nr:hypothetical protein [Lachnospiraceae bacterium]
MRLISCYIENFGGLQKFSYDFKPGLNTILEENGWGKSTLAAFLKAMFYGMERTTKRSLDENERKKYEPWNGGAYGGNLVFEAEGNEYRIERFFGVKDKEDSFILYDVGTGLQSNVYTERIGEELFGIDRVAFEQSIFMKQGIYTVSMTDSVAAKMSGLMASGDDLDCYEKACSRIDTEMKIYKKIGNKGRIPELTEEISTLNRKIADAKQVGASIDDWRKRESASLCTLESYRTRKNELKLKIKKAGEQAGLIEKSKYYNTLLEEKERLGHNLEQLGFYFRNGIPGEEELEEYRNKLFLYKKEDDEFITEKNIFRYPHMAELLKDNPMTEEELDACEQRWDSVRDKEILLEKTELQIQTIQIREEEKARYLQEKQEGFLVKQKIYFILAALLLIAAIVLYAVVGKVYALICFVLALSMAVLGTVYMFRKKKITGEQDIENSELVQLQSEREEVVKAIDNMKKAVRTYLHAFSPALEEDVPSCINKLRITILEMKAEEEKSLQQKLQKEKKRHEKEILREDLILFLRKFYQDIGEVKEFLFKEIEQKRNEYINTERQYQHKCNQIRETDKVDNIPEEEKLSVEVLQEEEMVLDQNIAEQEKHLRQIQQTITQYSQVMEECEKWEMEKQDLEELLTEYNVKYKLLEKTLKYLKTAQTEFSSRYLKKINQSFNGYANLFRDNVFEQSSLDVKLAVKADENGVKRDIGYYSKGMRETLELCTRLALIDALFEKEQPFVVLDDPFVNLDEKSLMGAKKVLMKLAEQYQLIYFTCHPSRH